MRHPAGVDRPRVRALVRWLAAALLAVLVVVVLPGDGQQPAGTSATRLALRPGSVTGGASEGGPVVPVVPVLPTATAPGRVFDGVGAVSGGGNTSRLLADYPPAQREQVLDQLFRPRYGASLQLLKVEIGADTDSTEGAQPSVEREPGRVECSRDAGNWAIMHAARARNPAITLVALEWGAPGWLRGGFWSQDNIDYLLSWLGCARSQGLTVDYLGGWNERGYRASWYTALAAALARSAPHTRLIAADSFGWSVADQARADPGFGRAAAVIGVHHPCQPQWRIATCPSTPVAQSLGTPLWASEVSAQDLDGGAQPLARELNLDYVDGRMTAAIVWSAASAFYDELPLSGRALLLAEQPWSGAYTVGLDSWVVAHTTQFAAPGWRYVDPASGRLPEGGSYVTLRAPSPGRGGADWSAVVETTQATGTQQLHLRPGRGLHRGPLHVWCSDLDSDDPGRWFVRQPDLAVSPDGARLALRSGLLCSVTTTTGQSRGAATGPPPGPLPLPFTASTTAPPGGSPPLFFDIDGAFGAEPCQGGHPGSCLAQQVTRAPLAWTPGPASPTTLVGDPTWWGDYTASVSMLPEQAPWVELLARVDSARGGAIGGYALRLSPDGRWQLTDETALRAPAQHDSGRGIPVDRALVSGRVAPSTGWRELALRMTGSRLAVVIDGSVRATLTDRSHTDGQVGLRVGGWAHAQFADLTVAPTAAPPAFLPATGLTATASSQLHDPAFNLDGRASRVLDGRPATLWTATAPATAARPQELTVALPRARRIAGVAVEPRRDGTSTGMVTAWRLQVSLDGTTFTTAASGTWPVSTATELVRLPGDPAVRAVRLVVTAAVGPGVTVAELRLVDPTG